MKMDADTRIMEFGTNIKANFLSVVTHCVSDSFV